MKTKSNQSIINYLLDPSQLTPNIYPKPTQNQSYYNIGLWVVVGGGILALFIGLGISLKVWLSPETVNLNSIEEHNPTISIKEETNALTNSDLDASTNKTIQINPGIYSELDSNPSVSGLSNSGPREDSEIVKNLKVDRFPNVVGGDFLIRKVYGNLCNDIFNFIDEFNSNYNNFISLKSIDEETKQSIINQDIKNIFICKENINKLSIEFGFLGNIPDHEITQEHKARRLEIGKEICRNVDIVIEIAPDIKVAWDTITKDNPQILLKLKARELESSLKETIIYAEKSINALEKFYENKLGNINDDTERKSFEHTKESLNIEEIILKSKIAIGKHKIMLESFTDNLDTQNERTTYDVLRKVEARIENIKNVTNYALAARESFLVIQSENERYLNEIKEFEEQRQKLVEIESQTSKSDFTNEIRPSEYNFLKPNEIAPPIILNIDLDKGYTLKNQSGFETGRLRSATNELVKKKEATRILTDNLRIFIEGKRHLESSLDEFRKLEENYSVSDLSTQQINSIIESQNQQVDNMLFPDFSHVKDYNNLPYENEKLAEYLSVPNVNYFEEQAKIVDDLIVSESKVNIHNEQDQFLASEQNVKGELLQNNFENHNNKDEFEYHMDSTNKF